MKQLDCLGPKLGPISSVGLICSPQWLGIELETPTLLWLMFRLSSICVQIQSIVSNLFILTKSHIFAFPACFVVVNFTNKHWKFRAFKY